MKNVRVKVKHYTCDNDFDFGIYEGRKQIFQRKSWDCWRTLEGAIRNAKAMAKRIGIKYDPEIIKMHGC